MQNTRSATFALILAVLAMFALGACSSSSDGDTPDPDPSETETETETGTEDGDTTSTTAPDELFTTSTIAPGSAPVPGSIESNEVTDLSVACAEAIEPIRELQDEYASGLMLTGDANDTLNAALDAGRAACDQEEFARFQTEEFAGWMNAVPEAAPES